MGYYVNIQSSNVVLPLAAQGEILKRWKDLNHPRYNEQKHGGAWSGGKQTQHWYSWLDADYDKKVTSSAEVLAMLGFEFEETEAGIEVKGYDSNTGQEDIFFNTIADLIPRGQSIVWEGEDGAAYGWGFDGKKMVVKDIERVDFDFLGDDEVVEQVESESPTMTQEDIEEKEMLKRRFRDLL